MHDLYYTDDIIGLLFEGETLSSDIQSFLDRLVSKLLGMSSSLNPTSSSLTAPPSRLSSFDLSVFALYSTAYSTAVSTGVRADRLFSYMSYVKASLR